MNNLKQIGLACHNYVESRGALPGARHGLQRDRALGTTMLMPLMEQSNVYNTINFDFNYQDLHQHDGHVHCREPVCLPIGYQ